MRVLVLACGLLLSATVGAVQPGEEGAAVAASAGIPLPAPAPDRGAQEGQGPYQHLVIDNVMLVDGLGSPPRGPVSLVIEEEQIAAIPSRKPEPVAGERRLDASGMTALPGFVDAHVHIGNPLRGWRVPLRHPSMCLSYGLPTASQRSETLALSWVWIGL